MRITRILGLVWEPALRLGTQRQQTPSSCFVLLRPCKQYSDISVCTNTTRQCYQVWNNCGLPAGMLPPVPAFNVGGVL